MHVPARPTLAFLKWLASQEDWGKTAERSTVSLGRPIRGKLHEIDHPIIRHAADTFQSGPEQVVQRESITGLTNPPWWKVKTARWRGAVHQDGDGIFWLCAAGLRREGEKSDFYKNFMADVEGSGPDDFLPTKADRDRLRLEQVEAELESWEGNLHREAGAQFAAVAVNGGSVRFDVPGIGMTDVLCAVTITVDVVVDEHDPELNIAEVYIKVARVNWAAADLAARADLIILTAIQPEEQDWDASAADDDGQPAFSLLASPAELDEMVAKHDPTGPPGAANPGRTAHYAHRERLADAAVHGEAVRALCEQWFVPSQSGEGLEMCPSCEAVHRNLPR